ncbi:MAG: hypothetical protein AB1918_16110 [Pseudomonadota bacterium]
MIIKPKTTSEQAHELCRLAFDLNSAALALAAEAAEIACRGLPLRDHDTRLDEMSRTLTDLLSDLDGGARALRRARLSAAWVHLTDTPFATSAQ